MANLLALIAGYLDTYLWAVTIMLLVMLVWTWLQLRRCRRESEETAGIHAEHLARLIANQRKSASQGGAQKEIRGKRLSVDR